MVYITPLVISALRGGHTDTHNTYQSTKQNNFKNPDTLSVAWLNKLTFYYLIT